MRQDEAVRCCHFGEPHAKSARRPRRKFSLVPNVMDEHGFAHLGGVTCEILYAACAR